jgi:threonine synthase
LILSGIRCTDCGFEYPKTGVPFICPKCGGVFDFVSLAPKGGLIGPNQTGIWGWNLSQDFGHELPKVSLGEGNTPLIWDSFAEKQIGMKCEFLNPTGSYKDRGTSTLMSELLVRKVNTAVEDSSGNAGASFAAYSAVAGIHAEVFIPSSASGPKKMQIVKYGAKVIEIAGPREAAAEAVRERALQGIVYASHAHLPFGLSGIATIAYELYSQLGKCPGTVIAPIGHGGLLLGVIRGFSALKQANPSLPIPYYVGVQAEICSPVVKAYDEGIIDFSKGCSGEPTIAEGVRVKNPARGKALLQEISGSKGTFLSIPEDQILPDSMELATRGFFVEPTSALVWAACKKLAKDLPGPIVLILTGSGLKYRDISS